MGAYSLLFSLDVEHEFFAAGRVADLEFVATSGSTRLMRNAGLLLRSAPNGVSVFFDQDDNDALRLYASDPTEPLRLAFKVYARDADFNHYTAPIGGRDEAILYFDNRAAQVEEGGKQRLHAGEHATEQDALIWSSPALQGLLDHSDQRVPPAFVVAISVTARRGRGAEWHYAPAGVHYCIKFAARRTYWKYYFIGNVNDRDFYITDLEDKLRFDDIGEAALSDSRTARVFRSQKAVPLRSRFEHRLQLREQGPGNGKVIMKRLPVATPDQIDRDIIQGEEVVVSEIYVNC